MNFFLPSRLGTIGDCNFSRFRGETMDKFRLSIIMHVSSFLFFCCLVRIAGSFSWLLCPGGWISSAAVPFLSQLLFLLIPFWSFEDIKRGFHRENSGMLKSNEIAIKKKRDELVLDAPKLVRAKIVKFLIHIDQKGPIKNHGSGCVVVVVVVAVNVAVVVVAVVV